MRKNIKMKNGNSAITVMTLATGSELVAGVISELTKKSDDISKEIDGVEVSDEMVIELSQSTFRNYVLQATKG